METENRFALASARNAGFATVAAHVASKRAAAEAQRAARVAARVVTHSDLWMTDGTIGARAEHAPTIVWALYNSVPVFFRGENGRIVRVSL